MTYKKFFGAATATLIVVIAISTLAPSAAAQTKFKTLHKFTGGADGAYPYAGLIFDQAGNLYGTTYQGGDLSCYYGCGTVFKLTPNSDGTWTESVLYSFTGGNDGAYPYASLIFDQAGNLYGTTAYGGAGGVGAVFMLTPNSDGTWTESVLYSFTGGNDGGYPVAGLVFDQAGNLYGTTGGTVFKLTPNSDGSWTESVLHSFGGKDGADALAGLIFDQAGNLYGTTYSGWRLGYGVVFELIPNPDGSWTESVLHSFTNGKDGGLPMASLIFDHSGNLYGTTYEGGAYDAGVVFKLTPNADGSWKERVLHAFIYDGKGGDFPSAGLILDGAGNLYGTTMHGGNSICYGDEGCGVVFKLAPDAHGGWNETVLRRFLLNPGAYPQAGVIFDAAGNLYGTTMGYYLGGTSGSVFELTP